MKKIICVCLTFCVLLVFTSCEMVGPGRESEKETKETAQPVYTQSPTWLQKRESVFVNLNSDGSPAEIQVTDQLITDRPQVRVEDVSFLYNIQNIKGNETVQSDGVNLTWHMQSSQLFYSGSTNKALPVELEIRYYLNNEEIKPNQLKGKKGNVKINIHAQNTNKHGNIYTPFLLVGGAIIENGKDIQVENGATLSDGNKDIVFGVLLPGIAESLQIKDNALLPSSFSFQFFTESFEVSELYFAMIPLATDKISDAFSGLLGGSMPELNFDGLLLSMENLSFNQEMLDFIQQAPKNMELLQSAAVVMKNIQDIAPLLQVLQKYLTQENALLLQNTLDALSGTALKDYTSLLKDPTFIALLADSGVVSEAFGDLIPKINELFDAVGSDSVKTAIQALPQTLNNLQILTSQIEGNESWFNQVYQMVDRGGFDQFITLMQSIRTMVHNGTLDAIMNLANQTDSLRDRMDAVLELGKKYSIFTIAPEDAVCSVYFIMKVNL